MGVVQILEAFVDGVNRWFDQGEITADQRDGRAAGGGEWNAPSNRPCRPRVWFHVRDKAPGNFVLAAVLRRRIIVNLAVTALQANVLVYFVTFGLSRESHERRCYSAMNS